MESGSYLLFKEKCFDEFWELQDEFFKIYELRNHTAWYYDHGLGVFTIKFEEFSYYFNYVYVGSFSYKSNTWKWSWDNEHTPENVKKGMDKIPLFGREKNFDILTTGLIEGDSTIGWELTAIANKFINGLGGYRAKSSDKLDIYFLFTKELDEEAYQKLKRKHISCGEHGSRRAAFVCQHLKHNAKTGFEESFPTYPGMELEEDDDLQAWCDECEKVRLKTDGWNEESEKSAKIKLICEKCYFEIKEFNLGYKEG